MDIYCFSLGLRPRWKAARRATACRNFKLKKVKVV
jgi:hypothetical protein